MTSGSQTPQDQAELKRLLALAEREYRAHRLPEAAEAYRQVLRRRPEIAEVHDLLGSILMELGQQGLAAGAFQRAIVLRPDFADAHYHLGHMLAAQHQLDQAAAEFLLVIALVPDHPEAYNRLGLVLRAQGKLDEAATRLEQAIARRPGFAQVYNNLAMVLRQQGKLDEAESRIQQALALRPDYADAHHLLGNLYLGEGRLDEAVAKFQEALALEPDNAELHNNLALALNTQEKRVAAAAEYETAVALQPDSFIFRFGLATCYLGAGDFQRGWSAFEARLSVSNSLPTLELPRWRGESLSGRTLMLVAEHGLGDTLQFVRYARPLKALGARIILLAQPPLVGLLASCRDVDQIFPLEPGIRLPRADYWLPLLSSPGALGTDLATIPGDVPYLAADPALIETWREELAQVDGFKIGIAWQGSTRFKWDRWRSLPLAQFAPLARIPGVKLISLQKGLGTEQILTVDFPVVDLSQRLDVAAGAFMDTAAVIRNLDLVVTSDTALPHLAGALAAPVFMALHFSGEWRWLSGRDDSPWYPTMQLFRQSVLGQWSDVFERIAAAVEARRAARS